MDGRLHSNSSKGAASIQPVATVHCTSEGHCVRLNLSNTLNTSSVNFYYHGKCTALITREGFFDFLVVRTLCDVSHSVAVVCQHDVKGNLVSTSNMSDIKLSLVGGFHSIQMFSSCDPGWFMVDDVCINFYLCPSCTNNIEAHKQCSMFGGQLAYHVLKNVTISTPRNKLDKETKLSLFWDMFHHMEDISPSVREAFTELENNTKLPLFWDMFNNMEVISSSVREAFKPRHFTLQKHQQKHQKYFAVNGSSLCVALYNSNKCTEGDIVLSVGSHNILFVDLKLQLNNYCFKHALLFKYLKGVSSTNYFLPMWSVIYQPNFELAEYKHFSLCEMSVGNAPILTNCSDFYMSCNEGTCIHDSLVCDGHSHCPHGEDEADCQHICSDHSHNCTYHCHHRDLCSCLPGYFQCLSGGCVPLQKLCDQTVHCIDASDEPPTCVYLRPEQTDSHSYLRPEHIGSQALTLDINKHINNLIQQNMIIEQRCLQSNESLFHVKNVEYKMHSKQQRTCLPSSLSPDFKFLCGIYDIPLAAGRGYFSLDRLCVYDHGCDDKFTYHCRNGFHLLKCEHMYCVGRLKCPSSYCVSFSYVCNTVCDCPNCEDESICSKLLCPGMVLIEQLGSGFRCSVELASLKYSMNLRQVIHTKDVNISDDFPVFIHLEGVSDIGQFILTPEVVVYCEIWYSQFNSTDVSVLHRMISVCRLLLPHNGIQKINDSMFAAMSQLIVLDLSYNHIKHLPQIILCALQKLQYISLHHNLLAELPARLFIYNHDVQVLLLESTVGNHYWW